MAYLRLKFRTPHYNYNRITSDSCFVRTTHLTPQKSCCLWNVHNTSPLCIRTVMHYTFASVLYLLIKTEADTQESKVVRDDASILPSNETVPIRRASWSTRFRLGSELNGLSVNCEWNHHISRIFITWSMKYVAVIVDMM